MDRLTHDLRIALRGFARSPSFVITSIAILAIGIGMAVAMLTVLDAVLRRPLPVQDERRIVELYTYRGDPKADHYLLRADLKRVAAASRTMRDVAGVVHWGAPEAPLLDGDRPIVVHRTLVTGNFFDVLGARPLHGRLLRSGDEAPGAPPVLVISYRVWQREFGGDPGIVGRRLVSPYGGERYEIVGVASPGLDYPTGVDVWMPAWQPSDQLSVIAVARLTPGSSMRAARDEFLAAMTRLFPERKFDGVHARGFTEAVVGDVRPVLVALTGAVSLLLLIACVNVGNLLLLRATGRARELAVRRALAATSWDVARQLLVESALLGVAGGVIGLVAARALVALLLRYAPSQLPRTDVIAISGAPALAAAGITLIAVLLCGTLPALAGARGRLASPLRFDTRAGTEGRARRRIRQVLVAAQIALALVMLAGAGLLGRSLARLQKLPLGYDPEHLSLLTISFPPSDVNGADGQFDQQRMYAVGDRLLERWRAVPGVTAVTPTLVPPYMGANIFVGRVDLAGQTPEETKANPFVPVEVGGTDYFRAFGIPIRRGRAFTHADGSNAPEVAIVSESIARRLWPNEDPVGQRIRFWNVDSTAWRTVVGVVGDLHWRSLREPTPSIFIPWCQAYWQGSFAIRTSGALSAVLPALRRATTDVNPAFTLWDAKPLDDLLAVPLARPRLAALLFGAFAVVSLLLAAIGLYGVMASMVRAGTREIGVRAALGASPERLRRSVLAQALGVSGAGAAVGLVVALASARLLASLLFEVRPTDPATIAGAAVVLLTVAMVAAYFPARRATRIDPVEALRSDQ